jgi:hypothetical protein
MTVNSLARVSRRRARPWSTYLQLSLLRDSIGDRAPSRPRTSVTVWFQALFTPLSGPFATFPRGTSFLSVLEDYRVRERKALSSLPLGVVLAFVPVGSYENLLRV